MLKAAMFRVRRSRMYTAKKSATAAVIPTTRCDTDDGHEKSRSRPMSPRSKKHATRITTNSRIAY